MKERLTAEEILNRIGYVQSAAQGLADGVDPVPNTLGNRLEAMVAVKAYQHILDWAADNQLDAGDER